VSIRNESFEMDMPTLGRDSAERDHACQGASQAKVHTGVHDWEAADPQGADRRIGAPMMARMVETMEAKKIAYNHRRGHTLSKQHARCVKWWE
jgi:hypothetical protein